MDQGLNGHTLQILIDAIAWWAVFAGVTGMPDCKRWFTLWRAGVRGESGVMSHWETLGYTFNFLGLIIGGITIPLTTRIEGFGITTPLPMALRLASWTLLAACGWFFVIGRSPRKPVMIAVCVLTILATLVASALTAHA